MKTQRSSTFIGVALALMIGASTVLSAQGPPEHVRRSVDAVVAMLRSSDAASIESFLDNSGDPKWLAANERSELVERIGEIRQQLTGLHSDLSVEGEPDGVRLRLSGSTGQKQLRVALSEAGVGGLELLGQEPGGAMDLTVDGHVQALEASGNRELSEVLDEFEQHRFSEQFLAETTQDQRRVLLSRIRDAASRAGGAMLDDNDGETVLTLSGPGQELAIVFRLTDAQPPKIDHLRAEEGEAPPELSWTELDQTFSELAAGGFSGAVHFARSGEVVFEKAYGSANKELGSAVKMDTLFGIGSTPIDFTIAGIFLLAQRGAVDLDAPISKYLEGVPADKKALTIRHLISGGSGLPDFHDIASDWDADLAWVDRDTAVRRILGQKLLFAPGSGRAHSHSAYGLVAAIIELQSGMGYESFLRKELFQPAGMTRTGMYGKSDGYSLAEWAEGRGPSSVGVPNIPPNWGPTSWLVMGSGGMYSTVPDLLRFYRLVRSDQLFEPEYRGRYSGETVGVGGSDRGFYLFHATNGQGNEALMIINGEGRAPAIRMLSRGIDRLVMGG